MCETTRWRDFLTSISSRDGYDVFYDPKYWDNPDSDATGYSMPESKIPWWAWITRLVSRIHDRIFLIRRTLSKTDGWAMYDEDEGLGCYDKSVAFGVRIRVHFWRRLFYVFKALLCVIFCYGRSGPDGSSYYDTVEVATYDFHSMMGEYSRTGWTTFAVGQGIFRNWFIREFSDSSC